MVSNFQSISDMIKQNLSKASKNVSGNNLYKINKAAVLSNTESFKPVYTIVISYPYTIYGSVNTVIVADTTKMGASILGLPISDILGMWVDTDDVGQPDKAVILLRIDPQYTKKTFIDNSSADPETYTENIVTDEDLAFNTYFSNRNWIDIWFGYKNVVTGELIPSTNDWFSETHIFSGPITMVSRKMGIQGDQLSIVALSGEIVLRHAVLRSKIRFEKKIKIKKQKGKTDPNLESLLNQITGSNFIIEDVDEKGDKVFLNQAMLILFKSIMSMSVWEERKKNNDIPDFAFVLGNFYYNMIELSLSNIKNVLEYGDVDSERNKIYPCIDEFLSTKMFSHEKSGDNKGLLLQSSLNLSGNVNFWDALHNFLKPSVSGVVGVGFKLLRKRNKPNSKENPFLAKEIFHPGIYFQFFLVLDVEEIATVMYDNDKNLIEASDNVQFATLGEDIIDMETSLDYDSVYNSFKIVSSSNVKLSGSTIQDPELLKKPVIQYLPMDLIGSLIGGLNPAGALDEFWQSIKDDITIFGEKVFPMQKWFTVTLDKLIEEQETFDLLRPEFRRLLSADKELKKIAGHHGVAAMFKRYYTAGLEGSIYCIGNPSFKTGRLLQIKDVRNANSTFWNNKTNQELNDKILSLAGKLGIETSVAQWSSESKKPLRLNTNFAKSINEFFYIWKVRHYYGPKSGYLSKVYFMKTRSRAWRNESRDSIGSIIRQAMRSSQEHFGN